jgi:hypothetical protein
MSHLKYPFVFFREVFAFSFVQEMGKRFMVLFFFVSFGVYGQGSLQFNQVLTLENSTNSCLVCWSVPAGKVWKVNSISTNSDGVMSLYVNNRELGYMMGSVFSTNSSSYWGNRWGVPFPFWLPGGASLGFSNAGSNRNTTFFVIEFNVIP